MCGILLGFLSGCNGEKENEGFSRKHVSSAALSFSITAKPVGTEPGLRTLQSFAPKRRSACAYLSTGSYHSLSQEALTIEWPDEVQAGGRSRGPDEGAPIVFRDLGRGLDADSCLNSQRDLTQEHTHTHTLHSLRLKEHYYY